MSTLGERLRSARAERGWTQAELAQRVGERSTSVISNWEKGNCNPDINKLIALCKALQVTPAYLLNYKPSPRDLAPEIESIIDELIYLDERGRNLVKTIVKIEYDRVKAGTGNVAKGGSEGAIPTRPINFYQLPATNGIGIVLSSDSFEPIDIPLTSKSREADFVLEVSGDSMTPEFEDGDLILIRTSDMPEPGEFGVFGLSGRAYFKRLGRGELQSQNKKYRPIKFTESDDILCFGRVLGKTERVDRYFDG